MNLSVETEENSDPISKISALLQANLSLKQENKNLKKSLENLQKKYKTTVNELERTIDSLRDQKLPQSEFYFENNVKGRNDSNNIQPSQIQSINSQIPLNNENSDSLLSQKLKNAEKEIQRLNKLLADQKKFNNENPRESNNWKNKDIRNENKYFTLLKTENDRLKKLIDQKELELTNAETTITEQKLEISKLALLQKEANIVIPIQDDLIATTENSNQNTESTIETFEQIFEEEIKRVSELSEQRSKLLEIIKKFEKICSLEATIKRKNDEEMKKEQIRKIEYETKEKVLENLFKRLNTAIQIKNNNFDDLLDEDDQFLSYDDKIIQLFQSVLNQKFNNITENQENSDDSNSSKQKSDSLVKRNVDFISFDDLSNNKSNEDININIENLDNIEIILGQLKNSCDFIRTFLKSKAFDKDAVISKCIEIEQFLKTQKPVPKIVTLFTNDPSISEQMKTFTQIRNNTKQKIELLSQNSQISQNSKKHQNTKTKAINLEELGKEYNEMIKILYNLFKAVLTVNSLLFESNKELTTMYQKVSSEKDSIQIKTELLEKNNEERMNYISSKLSPFLDITARNASPSNKDKNHGEVNQNQISSNLIEEGIEFICQQNIDLKVALKEKNIIIKKLKQGATKIVENGRIEQNDKIDQKKKVAKLESQLTKLNAKYQQMKQKDDELISHLKNDLDEALEALKNGDILEKELEEHKSKITKMKEKKESYDKLYDRMKQLTSENNELKLQIQSYESQIQRLTANVESNLKEIQNLTEKVKKIKNKKNVIKKENEQLLNKNRTEISELRTRNAKLENDMKNSFESLVTENSQLKEKVEQMTLDLQNVDELKTETAQKIAQANLQSKNARLQLIECQNALKMNKEVTEQQIFSMKSSFELELKKLKDEVEKCRKRFIFAFQIDNVNIQQYTKSRSNKNKGVCDVDQMSLFDLINTFISFYEPRKIFDYEKCCNLLKLNDDDTNLPLYCRCKSVMKNLNELNNTLNTKKKELNHVSLEIDDLGHQLNQKSIDSNAYKVLKKRIISLYIKMKKGQVPQSGNSSKSGINYNPNFELDSKEFDKVLNEIEEAVYINFLKPNCLQFKLDLMRTEKMILTDNRINKLVYIESSNDIINDDDKRNINIVRSIRPLSIVILFARRVCELSGYSQLYYVPNNLQNE